MYCKHPGNGRPRLFTTDEVIRCALAKELADYGITIRRAFEIAREVLVWREENWKERDSWWIGIANDPNAERIIGDDSFRCGAWHVALGPTAESVVDGAGSPAIVLNPKDFMQEIMRRLYRISLGKPAKPTAEEIDDVTRAS